jgi:DNA polymerase III epsilon subunit-like protein
MALIISIQTTGLPDRDGLPYGEYYSYKDLTKYDNARIVRISMMLCDQKFEQLEISDFIVKATSFVIENSHFHGITNEIAIEQGIPFNDITTTLVKYLKQVTKIVGHNADFILNTLKSELYRYNMNTIIEEIESKKVLCTMKSTKNIVKAKNSYGIKYPTLGELYRFVFNKIITNEFNSVENVININAIIKDMHIN